MMRLSAAPGLPLKHTHREWAPTAMCSVTHPIGALGWTETDTPPLASTEPSG